MNSILNEKEELNSKEGQNQSFVNQHIFEEFKSRVDHLTLAFLMTNPPK